ncbi:ferric-dicitrate binding protein FerR, regulates iron transport through sigma-19 [Chitinophaga eiseniae]|uniref:Ferric-dicitrate binding protein FerR, regulates iron transport through sigma-19 n=1 Tax=Chitinophaga eiseniae TaxID=634771 RepID=A0A1T4T8G4_9BACT|nr:FecR domain-containing protein [Chitinophaga eiseniae]SKA36775.1 ferric-dicitrate binding protein FerR, regulates iron transport through sigma-19 [Chitinophaga eiseniae]
MEQFYLLLEKFKKGQASASDIAQLEALMQQGADEPLKTAMLEAYQQSIVTKESVLSSEKTAALLDRLHAAMEAEVVAGTRKRSVRALLLPLSVAASVLILIGTVYLKHQADRTRSATPASVASRHISNISSGVKTLALADGSVIQLAPGSLLTWEDSTVLRRLTLQGKAEFIVQADTKRPFIVKTAGITVTALGTTFTVNAQTANKVVVKLSEGKVQIHTSLQQEDVYLSPGEEYAINTITRSFDIKKADSPKAPVNKAPEVNNVVLSFNNEPLDQALRTLAAHFQTKVYFQQEDVSALYFTGQVLKRDSLQSILAAICAMNQLELKGTADSIIISK